MKQSQRGAPATGIPALMGLLVVVFSIAGLLVFEAWSTGKARRDLAERGLQDYAAYATWSTARMADATVTASLATIFRGVVGARIAVGAQLPPVTVIDDDANYLSSCDCAVSIPARFYFRFDSRNGDLTTLAATTQSVAPPAGYASAKVGSFAQSEPRRVVSPRERDDVRRAIERSIASTNVNFAMSFARVGGSSSLIGYAPQRDASGKVIGAFGFSADPESYARALITHLWHHPKILPIAITRGLPSDSLFTASVSAPDGRVIYRSNGWSAGLRSDTASLAPLDGGFLVTVALRPDAVARLGADLIPPSRVPVLVGLLLLTGLLTAIILRNLQRDHELTRLRAEFTASVSHELRTPLAQILLFGETLTLGRTRSDTERARAAEVIVREARRLMQLVENTLQFSRAERPVVGLSPERMVLAPAVREVIAGFEPLAEAAGSNIVAQLDETSSAVVDRSAFRQMLLNLLDNALKYGPREQTITLHLSPPAEVVRISIDDEGPGIFGRSRDEIWAPFVRGNGGDLQATGCGLGLAVVRELATRHSGRAWVESPPSGRGARFVIELPAAGFSVVGTASAVA